MPCHAMKQYQAISGTISSSPSAARCGPGQVAGNVTGAVLGSEAWQEDPGPGGDDAGVGFVRLARGWTPCDAGSLSLKRMGRVRLNLEERGSPMSL